MNLSHAPMRFPVWIHAFRHLTCWNLTKLAKLGIVCVIVWLRDCVIVRLCDCDVYMNAFPRSSTSILTPQLLKLVQNCQNYTYLPIALNVSLDPFTWGLPVLFNMSMAVTQLKPNLVTIFHVFNLLICKTLYLWNFKFILCWTNSSCNYSVVNRLFMFS